jgi:hypothetical protein
VESVFEVLLRGRFSGSVLRGPLRGVLRGFIDCRDRVYFLRTYTSRCVFFSSLNAIVL